MKGFANFKQILRDLIDGNLREDIAFYPMGVPVNSITAHEYCCTLMVGKVWRNFEAVSPHEKWGFIGTFNVMQHFLYTSTQAFVNEGSCEKAI